MNVLDQPQLERLGAAFLGPTLASFNSWLGAQLHERDSKNVYFLAREGFFLKKAFEKLQALGFWHEYRAHYLLASRASLFRLALIDQSLLPLAISAHFNGTLQQLLLDRFLISRQELAELSISYPLATTRILLPRDRNLVFSIFEKNKAALAHLIHENYTQYLKYLDSVEINDQSELNFVDLGYSGTIQKCLTALTKKNSCGYYFIATSSADSIHSECRASFRACFGKDIAFGQGFTMLDRSLYLEAFLTSPDGQFSGIKASSDGFEPRFGPAGMSQRNFHVITAVVNGALAYLGEPAVLSAIETGRAAEWSNWIPAAYAAQLDDRSFFPRQVTQLLEIDDKMTGGGVLNLDRFFGQ